jgi:hypothetical protein
MHEYGGVSWNKKKTELPILAVNAPTANGIVAVVWPVSTRPLSLSWPFLMSEIVV